LHLKIDFITYGVHLPKSLTSLRHRDWRVASYMFGH